MIETIHTLDARTTNVCFGGPKHDQLFVTVDDLAAMVVFDLGVKGYRLPFCPSKSKDHPCSKMLPEIRGSKYNKDRNNANMFME